MSFGSEPWHSGFEFRAQPHQPVPRLVRRERDFCFDATGTMEAEHFVEPFTLHPSSQLAHNLVCFGRTKSPDAVGPMELGLETEGEDWLAFPPHAPLKAVLAEGILVADQERRVESPRLQFFFVLVS